MFCSIPAAAWENGTLYELGNTDRVISFTILNTRLKRYFIDNDRSTSRGFSSIFDEYNYAVKAYRAAEQQQVGRNGARYGEMWTGGTLMVILLQLTIF